MHNNLLHVLLEIQHSQTMVIDEPIVILQNNFSHFDAASSDPSMRLFLSHASKSFITSSLLSVVWVAYRIIT